MKIKGQPLLLLVMTVLLLVVISSRIEPGQAGGRKEPKVTDDPNPVSELPEQSEMPQFEPAEPVQIRELLPGLSLNDWNLKLVNNTYVLPKTFAPDVTKIQDEQYFDSRAVDALESMIAAAEDAGYTVCVRAAYRPFSTQAYIFNGRASQIQWGTTMTLMEAEQEARKVVAYPGTSEHQLGLCADLMDTAATSMTADTAEGLPLLQWLRANCAEYGFILRYPKEKQEITGWYEPWHFRYVGKEAAEYIMENGLCLEEFVEQF